MKVVYGHTDSIYVKIDTIEKAQETVEYLNKEVQSIFPNLLNLEEHPVVLEFEKFYSSLGVGTVKNRNAGLVSWKDGQFLKEKEFTMTGFTAKRISETPLGKEIQSKVLKMWIEGKTKEEIDSFCRSEYNRVLKGHASIKELAKRSRLKEDRLKTKCRCGKKSDLFQMMEKWIESHKAIENPEPFCSKCGLSFSNFTTLQGKKPSIKEGIAGLLYSKYELGYEFNDTILFCRILPQSRSFIHAITGKREVATYASANTLKELSRFIPDWSFYAEEVIKKAKPVYDAMGWDMKSIKNTQASLSEWW